MSFSNLFASGFKKRNQSHFASIVRVAMANGEISAEEKAFLDRLATRLEISDHTYQTILNNYNTYPINAPHSYDKRIERLYDLARMVWVDHIEHVSQVTLLKKLCIGLGFNPENADYIVDKALKLVHANSDLNTFTEKIKTMNQ